MKHLVPSDSSPEETVSSSLRVHGNLQREQRRRLAVRFVEVCEDTLAFNSSYFLETRRIEYSVEDAHSE